MNASQARFRQPFHKQTGVDNDKRLLALLSEVPLKGSATPGLRRDEASAEVNSYAVIE